MPARSLESVPGIGDARAAALRDAGYESVDDVADADVDALSDVSKVSATTARCLREAAKNERGDADTAAARYAEEFGVPRADVVEAYAHLAPLQVPPEDARAGLRELFAGDERSVFALDDYALRYRYLLYEAGYERLRDVAAASTEELAEVRYVGESLAEGLRAAVWDAGFDGAAGGASTTESTGGGPSTAESTTNGPSTATTGATTVETGAPDPEEPPTRTEAPAGASLDDLFPYESYRPYQRAALYEAAHALFEDEGTDTVVLNLPTGIGKSGINTTLARRADSAFLTTPQKALRTQLEEDATLREFYSVLRARDDYNCPAGSIYGSGAENYSCADCPINRADDESCLTWDDCTYWNRKERAMADPVAVLTFSYLVVDGFVPEFSQVERSEEGGTVESSTRISFGDRELLVVDECHKLEQQVASLHAGITVSPYTLPLEAVFGQVDREVGELSDLTVTTFPDVHEALDRAYSRALEFVEANGSAFGEDSTEVRECRNFCRKYEWCREQVSAGRDWVVDRREVSVAGTRRHAIEVRPVDVDRFLQEHVWSRADKQVLSTATMPFSGDPDRWIARLGLDPDRTTVVQHPMPFPTANRPVHTDTVVGQMSQGGYERHRDDVVAALRRLADSHEGEKGLVHTASYERARDLSAAFPENGVHQTRDGPDMRTQLDEWQRSDWDVFFSPAATDGVDLPYDACRWQALVKVPYPQPTDSRVKFMLDDRDAWDWYYEVTSQRIQQSVGRGVRSMDDHCDYYVLDGSFSDVLQRASAPEWFTEAIR